MSSRHLNNLEIQTVLTEYLREQGFIPMINEPLRNHCTWRIGGPADFLVEPPSWQHVRAILQFTHEYGIPAVVIGKGSNLLFDDEGFRGIVIKIGRKLSRLTISGTTVTAESGISTPRLAHIVGLAGLAGLEHTVGIPGTLGGLVVMNGGSQHKTISNVIVEVKVIDIHGAVHTIGHDECNFSYRHSIFQNADSIVVEVKMELTVGRLDEIMTEMLQILRERRRKFPLNMPNCGSVFKCTQELYETLAPPGAVIEKLGLKGLRVGDVAVSARHANFIVNRANAKARDVLSLIEMIRERVAQQIGLSLECEIQFVESTGVITSL